ncbi:MAG: hypothetical protein IH944_01145 [Armatimonadetes bacterium]|nr:hypothetical protein [Armatimonadota bacterium]
MPDTATLKPAQQSAREYADRLILEQLTELYEVMKPSEIADRLKDSGLGLPTVRSLLASNTEMFAYSERRWVPAARIAGHGAPFHEALKLVVEKFGAPMSLELAVQELSRTRGRSSEWVERAIRKIAATDRYIFLTRHDDLVPSSIVFIASEETLERAYIDNRITAEQVKAVKQELGRFNWMQDDAIMLALEKVSPVKLKALGAAAWLALSPQDPLALGLYEWRAFNAELLSVPGFVYSPDGLIYPESATGRWVKTAVRIAESIAPTIEIEDVAPLELKAADARALIKRVTSSKESVAAIALLEEVFEITPAVKTYPDDLANVMATLADSDKVWWVGGDRFRKPDSAPDFINQVPTPFRFVKTKNVDEVEGELIDVELSDEGLSSSLRKLLMHPLATDVRDEDILPEPKTIPESLRLVLRSIHRELGTFPMSQFHTGFFDAQPKIQELIFVDPNGRELSVWLNHKARLLFNLIDWWLDQSVESGSVFILTKTSKPNVFDFEWMEQADPVVYISVQRMETLREIAGRAKGLSSFDVLREVMTNWPKGADFLTILWEVNVVRRTSRRMLASLLSGYLCFYQRSGSPVWHYDHKKVEQGFDKTKKKFIIKK